MENRVAQLEMVVTNNANVSAEMWNKLSARIEELEVVLEAVILAVGIDDSALTECIEDATNKIAERRETLKQLAENAKKKPEQPALTPESVMQGGGESRHDDRAFVFGGES